MGSMDRFQRCDLIRIVGNLACIIITVEALLSHLLKFYRDLAASGEQFDASQVFCMIAVPQFFYTGAFQHLYARRDCYMMC